MRARGLRRLHDVELAGAGTSVGDVLPDAGREQHRLLEHDGELAAQVGEAVVTQVHAVEQNGAGGWVVEAREEAHDRRLAGPRRPGDRHARAGRDLERDTAQHGMVRVVREADVAERHRAGRAAQRPGVGAFGHVGALVEQRENALGAREVRLKPRRLPADRLQRIVELSEVAQHHQELAEREHPRADVAHADEQHGGHSQRGRESYQQSEPSFEQRQVDARRHAFVRTADEPVGLPRFLSEGLHHAQRAERLVDHRQRRGFELLHAPGLDAHARAVEARQNEQDRADAQRDERQLPVEPGGDDDHRHEGGRRADERYDSVHHQVLDCRGVLLDAVQRVGGPARVVIGHRQPLHLVDEPGAEVEDQPLTDVGAEQRAAERLELAEQRHDQEQADGDPEDGGGGASGGRRQHGPRERRQRARADDGIDDDLQRHRVEQRDGTRKQPDGEQAEELRPVWHCLAYQPSVQRDVAHHLPPEPVSNTELNRSCRRGGIATAEEGRAQHSNDVGDVGAVERIERVHGEIEAVTFVPTPKGRDVEAFRKSHIELDGSWSATGVAGHARRSIVGNGVPVVVKSCRDVEW